ncbi:MAG TPA: flagellar hook-basal body complex protein FliE [Nitrospinota bacterium]|jgi:flagellar hook-basal body complex protein FliE|nr:flagellar hook-basal body complex protein FliE [Nitrospinota bacterium]
MNDITIQSGLKTILNPGLGNLSGAENVTSVKQKGEKSFGESLVESLEKVNDLQLKADKTVEELATGKTQSIHETMLALSKADIAFRLTMQVRNKVVEAYQEIMRMPV